jgi:hypothetical protein
MARAVAELFIRKIQLYGFIRQQSRFLKVGEAFGIKSFQLINLRM